VEGPLSCARAASAAEAAYRIDAPIAPARAARVVALDAGAAEVVRTVQDGPWVNAHFFVCEGVAQGDASTSGLLLRGLDGAPAALVDELDRADVVVMIATEDSGADCAYEIGKACWERSIQTAGLVLGDGSATLAAVAALRPHARVLLPSADQTDVVELLAALRA
jgi:hypothetical protein